MTLENPGSEQEVTEETPQAVVETPVATPSPAPAPVQTITNVNPNPDHEALLAQKDKEIEQLTKNWTETKNSHHMTQGEIQKAREALALAVQERERIVAAKDQALEEAQKQLETQSQATQTLSQERTTLTQQLEAEAAKATKLEILTEEFPELLRYSKLIPASRDAETVRAACKALAEARKLDLEAQRISAVTGNGISQTASGVTRVEPQVSSPEEMRAFLDEARNDPKEYERRRQLLLDRHNAAVSRLQAGSS